MGSVTPLLGSNSGLPIAQFWWTAVGGVTHLDYIMDGASRAVQLDSPGAGGSEGWCLEASRDYTLGGRQEGKMCSRGA